MPITTYKIIGYVDDNPKSLSIAKEYPCLGAFKDVERVIKDTGVQTVLICAPGLESQKLVYLINRLQVLVKGWPLFLNYSVYQQVILQLMA